jgi:hypothetical protein
MKTDELIKLLAADATPVDSSLPARRLGLALTVGAVLTLLLMVAVFGLRPDMVTAAALPMFWVKLGYPLLIATAALVCLWRLAHPGLRLGWAGLGLLLPWLLMLVLALFTLLSASADARADLLLGHTAKVCALNIGFLSLPVFAALLYGLQALAPTRLRLAGASAGLLAGALATTAYALHCQEMAAPFVAIWYTAGMLVPAAIGAWLGPRTLRW